MVLQVAWPSRCGETGEGLRAGGAPGHPAVSSLLSLVPARATSKLLQLQSIFKKGLQGQVVLETSPHKRSLTSLAQQQCGTRAGGEDDRSVGVSPPCLTLLLWILNILPCCSFQSTIICRELFSSFFGDLLIWSDLKGSAWDLDGRQLWGNSVPRTSLADQWSRLCLPVQGVQVRSQVSELRSYMSCSQKIRT